MGSRHCDDGADNGTEFREANERIVMALDDFHGNDYHGILEIMCECALGDCRSMLQLMRPEYANVRSDPAWFVVIPKHVRPKRDRILQEHSHYWIIDRPGPVNASEMEG